MRAGPQPDRPALEHAPLVLAHPAPDAGVLTGLDRPAQALFHYRAAAADLFRQSVELGRELVTVDQDIARLSDPQQARPNSAELLTAAPDLQLELVDSATVPGPAEGEQLVFLHYVGHATGPNGRIEIRGLDRVRTRDGMVVENVIRYDPVFVTQT